MAEIIFNYQRKEYKIECSIKEKMKEICNKFGNKIGKDISTLNFLYNSEKINDNYSFAQQANQQDIKRNLMTITVYEKYCIKNNIIKYKEIICPECGENSLINVDNYKIMLYNCKNKHVKSNIFFDEFKNIQYKDNSKRICNKCNNEIKNNLNNSKLYKCYSCEIMLCKLCKSFHDKNHKIINYDKKNYKCNIHNDIYSSYCSNCKINLCMLCENNHKNHIIMYYKNMMPNIDNLRNEMNEFKNKLDIFDNEIKTIIKILEKTKENLYEYYKINIDMINNFEIKNRNFQILQNLYNIKNNNKNILKDIDEIINDKNIYYKVYHIINIYNKMYTIEKKLISASIPLSINTATGSSLFM